MQNVYIFQKCSINLKMIPDQQENQAKALFTHNQAACHSQWKVDQSHNVLSQQFVTMDRMWVFP